MIKRLLYLIVAIVDVALHFMGYYDWKVTGFIFAGFVGIYFLLKRFLF